MRYKDFERHLHELAASASDLSRRRFALDTISRLHAMANDAISTQLTPEERELADYLNNNVADSDPQTISQKLDALNGRMTTDPIRAIEFRPSITEWMCAIDNWIAYLASGDPSAIAELAVNMVNSINYTIGCDIKNMLGSPEMQTEHERQKRLLVAASVT